MNNHRGSTNRELPNIPGSYYERIIQARQLIDQSRWEEASAIQERIIERLLRLPESRRQPGSDHARFLIIAASDLYLVRLEQQDADGARALCRQLESWDSTRAPSWRRRFYRTYIEEGKTDEGLEGLRQLADREPDDWNNWLELAHEAIFAGRYDGVESWLEKALSLAKERGYDEDLALVHFTFYNFYARQKRWQEACDAWDLAVALNNDLERYQEQILHLLIEAEEIDLAFSYIDDQALTPPIADYYRALIAHRRGDRVRARHLWRQIATTDPKDFPDAIFARSLARCWIGKPLEALGELLSFVKNSKSISDRAAIILALAWAMQGNAEATHGNLALAAHQLKRYGKKISAVEWYEFEHLVEAGALKEEIRSYFELPDLAEASL